MKTRTASEIQEEPIQWLWPSRIPRGCLTILEGDADIGKSRLTMELAALVSRGGKWPDSPAAAPLGTVLVANAEDPDESVTKPRLVASGANLDNIEIFQLDDPMDKDPFQIPASIPVLASRVQALNARPGRPPVRLITIDPLNAFWTKGVNPNDDTAVRQALRPFNGLAKMFDLAVVSLRHLTKGSDGNAKHRGLGSVAIGALARSCMLVALDPTNKARSLILPVKGNWDMKPPSWIFSQETYVYTTPSGVNIKTSKLIFGGKDRRTADDLSRPDPNPPSAPEMELAEEFLRVELKDGPVDSELLKKKAIALGGPNMKDAIWRQSFAMEIVKRRNGHDNFTWELPPDCSDMDFTNA